MKIFANTIVNNEENFVWFAVMSVIDYVDKILIYDTGSNDNTAEIIEELERLHSNKIIFKEVGKVDDREFTKMRQAMLDESDCDWLLILDGDEIWWEDSIKKLVKEISTKGGEIDGIVVPFVVPVGDIFHFQKESAGHYRLLGRKGHLSLRAINKKIPGLHLGGAYGIEGYLDEKDIPIQNRNQNRLKFINAPFLHATHLNRSSRDDHHKFKLESGLEVPSNFSFPEVFHKNWPKVVKSPFTKRSKLYELVAFLMAPYLSIKRGLKK